MLSVRKLLLVSVLLMLCSGLSAREEALPTLNLDIPALPISDALLEFSRQAGIQVVFDAKAGDGISVAPVKGRLTAPMALGKLLANTGLNFEYLNDRTIAVRPAAEVTQEVGAAASPASVLRLAEENTNAAGAAASTQRSEENGSLNTADTSPSGKVEEIVVTAQKRGDERLQDVPIPISVLSATTLLQNGATGLQDYFSKVPGVSLVSGVGGTSTVLIRGLATNGLNDNPTVGVIVDGAPYGATTFLGGGLQPIDMDPNEVSQIEVLRGPQGTLYGANSIGGLLKYVMVDPSLNEFGGRVTVTTQSPVSNDGLDYGVRGAVNLPISSNLAMRVSGFDRREAGYIDDAFGGRNGINGGHSYGGRAALLWRANEDWSVKLSAVRQLLRTDAANVLDFASSEAERLESNDYIPGRSGANRSVTFLTGVINGSISGIDLTSTTAYTRSQSTMREGFTDGVFQFLSQLADPGADAGFFTDIQPVSKFSQEFTASIPIRGNIDWQVGAFYTEEYGEYREEIAPGLRANGEKVGSFNVIGGLGSGFEVDYTEIAAFTNLLVRFTDRFDVQFGGRLSENRQRLYNPPGPPTLLFPAGTAADEGRSTDNPLTYLITPRFKLTDYLMVYSRIASGYRSGGPSFNRTLPGAPDALVADTTENYELGIKGDLFDQRLSIDVSAYYIDWTDIPVGVQPDPDVILGYNLNAGAAISKGLELSFVLRPAQGLSFSAWGAWSDAYINKLPANSTAPFEEGDRLPFSPKFSGNVSIDYERPLFATMIGSAGAAVRYVGDRCAGVGQCEDTMAAYTQVDAYAGFKSGGWTVNVFANNLTDERGIIGPKPLTAFAPNNGILIIRPRTIGVSASVDF